MTNATDSPSITIDHEHVGEIGSAAKAFDIGLFDDELFLLVVNISRLRKNKRALLVTTEVGLDGGANHAQNGESSCEIGRLGTQPRAAVGTDGAAAEQILRHLLAEGVQKHIRRGEFRIEAHLEHILHQIGKDGPELGRSAFLAPPGTSLGEPADKHVDDGLAAGSARGQLRNIPRILCGFRCAAAVFLLFLFVAEPGSNRDGHGNARLNQVKEQRRHHLDMALLIAEAAAAAARPPPGRRAPPGRDGRLERQGRRGGAGSTAADAGRVQQLHRSELGHILGRVRAHGLPRGRHLEHEGEQILHDDGPVARVAAEDGGDEGDGGDLHDVREGGVALGRLGRLQRHGRQDRGADGHELLILELDGPDEELDAFHEDREEADRGADGLVHLLEVVGQLSRLAGLGSLPGLLGGGRGRRSGLVLGPLPSLAGGDLGGRPRCDRRGRGGAQMSRLADGGKDVADEMLPEERHAGLDGVLGHGPLVDAAGRDDGQEDGGRLQPPLDDLEAMVAGSGIRDAVRGVVARARYPLYFREVVAVNGGWIDLCEVGIGR